MCTGLSGERILRLLAHHSKLHSWTQSREPILDVRFTEVAQVCHSPDNDGRPGELVLFRFERVVLGITES